MIRLPDIPTQWLVPAQAICETGASLFARGYVHGSTGNISVKLEMPGATVYLMTPTDACLGNLQAQRLALLDAKGQQLFGDPVSKAQRLHRAIYDADPSASAVIHTHSHHLVLLTLLGVWRDDSILPFITPYQVMKVGRVPLIQYAVPGDEKVVVAVSDVIKQAVSKQEPLRAVMCDRLGPQVWHQSLAQAQAVLEELAQTARLWIDGGRMIEPLSPAQIDALRQRFLSR